MNQPITHSHNGTGLSAARELKSAGLDVLVLEARDRVGGRTLTKVDSQLKAKDGHELWIDLGGSYVGPTQNCVLNLCEEFGLETYLVEDTKDMTYMRTTIGNNKCCNLIGTLRRLLTGGDAGGKQASSSSSSSPPLSSKKESQVDIRVKFDPRSDIPFGSLFHWLDYVNMIKLIDSLGAQIPSEAPWLAPREVRQLDSITFKQFVDSNAWTKRVRGFLNNVYVTVDVCCDANEVSALWFLWYVKQCGGFGRTISTTNGGQERKIKQGTQQLSCRLRDSIGRQRVLINKPVCRLDQTITMAGSTTSAAGAQPVLVQTVDGAKFYADYVICAIPPHLWLKIHHKPGLPAGKNLLAQRSPMGQVAKVILYYERAFWKEAQVAANAADGVAGTGSAGSGAGSFSGMFLFDAQDRSAQPVILSLDETKPDGSFPAIIGFVAARGWFEMRTKSLEEIGRIVAASYAAATNLDEFNRFIRVEKFDWTEEQYSGGCYTSTHQINTLTKYGRHLREPFGRIHYAGTETAIKWSGYMDGAISAGKRAAREILHQMGKLQAEEIWREDEESKLVPARPYHYPTAYKCAPSIGGLLKTGSNLLLLAGVWLTFSKLTNAYTCWPHLCALPTATAASCSSLLSKLLPAKLASSA